MSGPRFGTYVGVDYSGARSATDGLPGLRVYVADGERPPREVRPDGGRGRRHWTRRGVAGLLARVLRRDVPALVGVDHAFSFPLRYFDEHGLARDWPAFLDDFCAHWPTDAPGVTVEAVRRGERGCGALRTGSSRWRRPVDVRAGAKSPFHFDVPGSVAKSTHAGLPWLRRLRRALRGRVHVWPFDGWEPSAGCSVLAEVYPALWSGAWPRGRRTPDQHDAWSVAARLRAADRAGELDAWLRPPLAGGERAAAGVEGWILGVR